MELDLLPNLKTQKETELLYTNPNNDDKKTTANSTYTNKDDKQLKSQ